MDIDEEDQEELDPRVQVELEKLNTSTDEVNRLESQLEEANTLFRATLSQSTARLKSLAKNLGTSIEKARPYYEAVEEARVSQLDCQRAAVQYQRSNALHAAAKETISLAEERFIKCKDEKWQFDSAWQEMLNHATIKVMEAEAQKAASEREHMKRASSYGQMQLGVMKLQKGLKSSISKSRIYFEQKEQVQAMLNSQKENVQHLQRAITANKTIYSQTLRSLEQISEEIHEARRCRLPREPGVGAEINVPIASDTSNLQRHNSAMNLHSALEEQTAQEEKYWESLREKLEEMNPSDYEPLETGAKDISTEFLDSRQRSLTGSSDVEDLERIVSGESETEDKSDSEDMSDNEEIIELSLSLENINLHCREDGVGSENENIILKDEDNDNENSNDKLREDSSTIREVGIGNEKDNKFGYENTSVIIINDGEEECDFNSPGSGCEALSYNKDVMDNPQQEIRRTSPLGVRFTCHTPDLYPSLPFDESEYDKSKTYLEIKESVDRISFRTNKLISEPEIYNSDILDRLICDNLDNDNNESVDKECNEDRDSNINSLSQFSTELPTKNDNDKEYVNKNDVLSETCATNNISDDENVNNISDQSSFDLNNGNDSKNEVCLSNNDSNKNNEDNDNNDNDNVLESTAQHERSPVMMCKPKAGLPIIPEH